MVSLNDKSGSSSNLETESAGDFRAQLDKAVAGLGRHCFECGSSVYQPWISVTYGILLCIKCAGEHRGLGVAISRIKDFNFGTDFSLKDIRTIQFGGNRRIKNHLNNSYSTLNEKYTSKEAAQYRTFLEDLVIKCIDKNLKVVQDEKAIDILISELSGNEVNKDIKNEENTAKQSSVTICDHSESKATRFKKKKGLSALNDEAPLFDDSANKIRFTSSAQRKSSNVVHSNEKINSSKENKKSPSTTPPAATAPPKTPLYIKTDAEADKSKNRLGFFSGASLIRDDQKVKVKSDLPNTKIKSNTDPKPSLRHDNANRNNESENKNFQNYLDTDSRNNQNSAWKSFLSGALNKMNEFLD